MKAVAAFLIFAVVLVEAVVPTVPSLPGEIALPVSYPPLPGTFRIRSKGNDRYLHEKGILQIRHVRSEQFLPITYDRYISTRYTTSESNTWTHFRFIPTSTPEYYNIQVVASDRYINEDPSDNLISTRTQVMDNYAKFKFVEYCDGTVMIYSLGSGKFLRADSPTTYSADDLVSTRHQVAIGAGDPLTRFYIEPVDVTQNVPSGYSDMEIEAKWGISSTTMNLLKAGFPHGGSYVVPGGQTYNLNVRWSGISRKYFDRYYDTVTDTLAADKHSYRIRSRYTSSPLAADNDWNTLSSANWDFDWTKVQYKSTPVRLNAVWFRKETGDCRIADSDPGDVDCLVTDENTILGGSLLHPANGAVLADHPGFGFAMTKRTEVEDYRYRIELTAVGDTEPSFEISIDQLETFSHTDSFTNGVRSYEAELEILNTPVSMPDVQELFRIVEKMESDYYLTAQKRSKGGIPLDNGFIPGDSGSCVLVPIIAAPLPPSKD